MDYMDLFINNYDRYASIEDMALKYSADVETIIDNLASATYAYLNADTISNSYNAGMSTGNVFDLVFSAAYNEDVASKNINTYLVASVANIPNNKAKASFLTSLRNSYLSLILNKWLNYLPTTNADGSTPSLAGSIGSIDTTAIMGSNIYKSIVNTLDQVITRLSIAG